MRIYAHKVMKKIATRSKTTTGWFYGLKLHIVTDLKRNILMMKFTTGRVDDRVVLDEFLDQLKNSLVLVDLAWAVYDDNYERKNPLIRNKFCRNMWLHSSEAK